jgi:hypothetical protein
MRRTDMRDLLKNGAEVLKRRGDFVLARWDKGSRVELVTWGVDAEGNAYWGHYFDDLDAAFHDLNKRAGGVA